MRGRLLSLFGSLLRNRRLLREFVVRDLKARYVGSSMGFFWSVVFPIINLFVYMFVFRLVLNARWSDRQGPAEVALVMLAGIVVWSAFAETVSRSTNTLVDNSNLIQKVVFPAEILPCYLTVSSLINMCIGLPVVLGCVAWFAFLSPPTVFLKVPGQLVPGPDGPVWSADEVRLGEAHAPYALFLELTRGTHRDVRVPFTLSGTAVEGEDYLLDAREAVIERGDPRVTLLFTPLPDAQTEGEETIVIELGEPRGALPVEPDYGPWATSRLQFALVDGPPPEAGDPPRAPAPAFRRPPPPDPDEDPMSVYYPLDLGPALLALPVLFALQVLFTVGLGYFLSTLNVFLRDTYHLVGVGITVWMFATPIFYPAGMVENAGFGWLLQLNPMHWLIDAYRSVLLYARLPDLLLVGKLAAVALLAFLLGGAFFMSHKPKFPDLL